MSRTLTSLFLLLAIVVSTATLHAAELSLSLGIRQTFPAGDANGDLVIDQLDYDLWEEWEGSIGDGFAADANGDKSINSIDEDIIVQNQGASTTGIIGSDGGTSGPTATTGSQTLTADGTWQLMTFTLPLDLFSPASDWGTLESFRFINTTDGETQYQVWIDDLANTNASGTTTIADFESSAVGDEVLFHEPSFSGATSGNLLPSPDLAEVTDSMATPAANR